LLAGCTTVQNLLGSKNNERPPNPLPALSDALPIRVVWRADTAGADPSLYLGLSPALGDGLVFVAGYKGNVTALEEVSGEVRWLASTKMRISGGPGYGSKRVVVGSEEGEVAAFDPDNGRQLWKHRVSSEVLSPPLVGPEIVVVRTVDGKVFGLKAADGSVVWIYDRAVPALSLRGTGLPVMAAGQVIAGFDNGRLSALRARDGEELWTSRASTPAGRTELQRLVDVDAAPVVDEGVVYAVTFQGRLAAMDSRSGSIIWRRRMSSYSGLALDEHRLFVTDQDGVVWAISRDTAATLWQQNALSGRRLSAPAVDGDFLVVGDLEGYAHWLDRRTGKVMGRVRVGSAPIRARPVRSEQGLVILGAEGDLAVVRAEAGTRRTSR